MLAQSRLNVYIQADHLTPKLKERIQAQVSTALQDVPHWAWAHVDRKSLDLDARALPLIVEPLPGGESRPKLSFGEIDGRPAVRISPTVQGRDVAWGQDRRYVILKAVAYLGAPPANDTAFWARWSHAVEADGLRQKASDSGRHWADATDLDLFIEMFAAYASRSGRAGRDSMPAVRDFLDGWR